METAGRRCHAPLLDAKRSRHTEMHHEHVARGELGKAGTCRVEPSDAHRLTLEPRREASRERDTEIRSARHDLVESRALDDRTQRATNGFDLRKLGQVSSHCVQTFVQQSLGRRAGGDGRQLCSAVRFSSLQFSVASASRRAAGVGRVHSRGRTSRGNGQATACRPSPSLRGRQENDGRLHLNRTECDVGRQTGLEHAQRARSRLDRSGILGLAHHLQRGGLRPSAG